MPIRSWMLRIAACVLALWIAGCPGAPVVDDNDNTNVNDNEDPVAATAEIGYSDEAGLNYAAIEDGGVMPLFTSGQGGSHMFATIRATGFPLDADGAAEITLDQLVTLTSDSSVIHDFEAPVRFFVVEGEDGVVEAQSRTVIFTVPPDRVNGQVIHVTFVLTSVVDPTITATIDQDLLMQLQ